MSFESVGCVGCVVGAEQLATNAGVWVKARFFRDGHHLCATVYSVSQGEPKVFEMRVDLRPIERALMRKHAAVHAKGMARASLRGQPTVGWGLGSLWKGVKKTAKKIGRVKLVKGIVNVTKAVGKVAVKVAKSKEFGAVLAVASAFPLTAPFAGPALAAYAFANTAIAGVEQGKKLLTVAKTASTVIKKGAQLAKTATNSGKQATAIVKSASASLSPAQRAQIAASAKAAGKVSLTPKGQAALRSAFARVPTAMRKVMAGKVQKKLSQAAQVKTQVALARRLPGPAGAAVLKATRTAVAAAPAIALAKRTAARLKQPAVRARLSRMKTQAEKSKAALTAIQQKAKTGSLDAQKNAAIVNLVARNRARIQAMSQASAAGLPGLLITPEGKIKRGRFRVQAAAGGKSRGLLYQGPGKTERGAFTTVSGFRPDILVGCACEARAV